MFLIIIFIILLCIYCYISRRIETYKTFDYSDPEVIKKLLDVNNYDSEKKKVSYTLNTKPKDSMRYFLDEHRGEFIEPIPFSPHQILYGTPAQTLSKKIDLKDDLDEINNLDNYIKDEYNIENDACSLNKSLPECSSDNSNKLGKDDFCTKDENKHSKRCIKAERSFKCFGKIEYTEKECTAKTDIIGNRVKSGIWDRRCIADEECPFFKANKNYPNDFGKCLDGICELPTGIKPLGYRKFDINTLPLCYNCIDEKTGKKTKDHCCDTQHRPDYVFKDDIKQRYIYRKQLEEKGLSTTMNDNYDKEFRLLEKKLKI